MELSDAGAQQICPAPGAGEDSFHDAVTGMLRPLSPDLKSTFTLGTNEGTASPVPSTLFEIAADVDGVHLDGSGRIFVVAAQLEPTGRSKTMIFAPEDPGTTMNVFKAGTGRYTSRADGRFCVLNCWGNEKVITIEFGKDGPVVIGGFFKGDRFNSIHCIDSGRLVAVKDYTTGGGMFSVSRCSLVVLDPKTGTPSFETDYMAIHQALGDAGLPCDYHADVQAVACPDGVPFLGINIPVRDPGTGGIAAIQDGRLVKAGVPRKFSFSTAMSFSPDGKRFAAAQDDDFYWVANYPQAPIARDYAASDTIHVFRRNDGETVFKPSHEIQKTGGDFMCLAFSPDEKLLAGAAVCQDTRDGPREDRIFVWDVSHAKEKLFVNAPLKCAGTIGQIRFSGNDTLLLVRNVPKDRNGGETLYSSIDQIRF